MQKYFHVMLAILLAVGVVAAAAAQEEKPADQKGFDDEKGAAHPKIVRLVEPEYPKEAVAEKVEGTVIVKVLVLADGQVGEVAVLQAVDPRLDEAAVAAAGQCEFEPARQNGQPVKAWLSLPFAFQLE